MVTKNFNSLIAAVLQSVSQNCGSLAVTDVTGRRWYAGGAFGPSNCFPAGRVSNPVLKADDAGISIGRGASAATVDDYQLEDPITSGVSMTMIKIDLDCDAPGAPYVRYVLSVSNTSEESVTVREIGFKQNITATRAPGIGSAALKVCLLDRTVLSAPLTIAPGCVGIIEYKLRTDATAVREVSGVEIVGWEWGTDAQIAAMLDAAHNGVIDLQEDAQWRVGDVRRVHVAAFTGGSGVLRDAQTVGLVISGFSDTYDCGCVMQFDFIDALSHGERMNASATNVGGYGGSEMKTTTLPALADALPDWLKSRLLTFDVDASEGTGSSTIVTVTGNKLALRAEKELTGATSLSFDGEGDQNALFRIADYRRRGLGLNSSAANCWLRSPLKPRSGYPEEPKRFVSFYTSPDRNNSSGAELGVAPFGCL